MDTHLNLLIRCNNPSGDPLQQMKPSAHISDIIDPMNMPIPTAITIEPQDPAHAAGSI